MSARLRIQDLSGEDVDLLLSRSIDGDLSPEDQAELDLALAADPALRHRRDVLAGTVDDLKSLPAPEPPFALATRVNSQVGERIASLGSFWHRFGLYPPPGMVGAAVGLLALVVVGMNVLTPVKKSAVNVAAPAASESNGPVSVFFSDKKAEKAPAEEAPVAKRAVVEDSRTAELHQKSADKDRAVNGPTNAARPAAGFAPEAPSLVASAEPRRQGGEGFKAEDQLQVATKTKEAKARANETRAADQTVDTIAGKLDRGDAARPAQPTMDERPAKQAETLASTSTGRVSAAPGTTDRAESAAGGAAPAPPAAAAPKPAALAAAAETKPAGERDAEASRAFVERERRLAKTEAAAKKESKNEAPRLQLVSGAGWRLVSNRVTAPTGRYRIVLDVAGRVTAVRTAEGGRVDAQLEHLFRGLVFEKTGGIAGTDVVLESR